MANFPIKMLNFGYQYTFVILPIDDTDIFGQYTDIPIADTIIGATLLTTFWNYTNQCIRGELAPLIRAYDKGGILINNSTCFMLSSLPSFPAFCWSAVPTSCYIFNVYVCYTLVVEYCVCMWHVALLQLINVIIITLVTKHASAENDLRTSGISKLLTT